MLGPDYESQFSPKPPFDDLERWRGQAPGRNKWLISKLIERNSAAVCYVKNRNKVWLVMNGTELITFLSRNLDSIGSAVGPVTGALFTAIFLRHNTKTDEFEKIIKDALRYYGLINL